MSWYVVCLIALPVVQAVVLVVAFAVRAVRYRLAVARLLGRNKVVLYGPSSAVVSGLVGYSNTPVAAVCMKTGERRVVSLVYEHVGPESLSYMSPAARFWTVHVQKRYIDFLVFHLTDGRRVLRTPPYFTGRDTLLSVLDVEANKDIIIRVKGPALRPGTDRPAVDSYVTSDDVYDDDDKMLFWEFEDA